MNLDTSIILRSSHVLVLLHVQDELQSVLRSGFLYSGFRSAIKLEADSEVREYCLKRFRRIAIFAIPGTSTNTSDQPNSIFLMLNIDAPGTDPALEQRTMSHKTSKVRSTRNSSI